MRTDKAYEALSREIAGVLELETVSHEKAVVAAHDVAIEASRGKAQFGLYAVALAMLLPREQRAFDALVNESGALTYRPQ